MSTKLPTIPTINMDNLEALSVETNTPNNDNPISTNNAHAFFYWQFHMLSDI